MQRVYLVISGDVQGVGFRAWVRETAKRLGLTGWVKNREDGAVELVAEGVQKNVEELTNECHHGPEVAWITKVDVVWEDATNEYIGFDIVY